MKSKRLILLLATVSIAGTVFTGCGKSPVLPPDLNNPLNPPNYNQPGTGFPGAPVTGMGSITGRVVDSTGKGLPGVQVSIFNNMAITSQSGDYQLNNVPQGQQQMLLRYGNRQMTINVSIIADSSTTPEINPLQFANNGTNGSGIANSMLQNFKVDQDFFNQWQAKGVAVSGGTIYVAVSDKSRLFKKGSVIKMDSSTGKSWSDIGSAWLGLRYKIDESVEAVDINGTSLVAVDSKDSIYMMESAKGSVKVVKSGGGTDVAVGAGTIYISNGASVEKAESSGEGRTAIPNLTISGGIGSDSRGNLYAISGNGIKRVDYGNYTNPVDIVTEGVRDGIDIAVDSKNGFIYVLETSQVKRFDMNGILEASFGTGTQKAVGIAVDELGNVYVADEGNKFKESKIVKFGPGSKKLTGYENPEYVRNREGDTYGDYGNDSYNDYSDYNY